MEQKEYYWKFNKDEEFYGNSADSVEDCIEDAKKDMEWCEDKYEKVYIGELDRYKPSLDFEDVIEHLQEEAYWACGEVTEGWLDNLDSDTKLEFTIALDRVLWNFLESNKLVPDFGTVENVEEYEL